MFATPAPTPPCGVWRPFAVRDGKLVTRQQKFFAAQTARAVIAALGV